MLYKKSGFISVGHWSCLVDFQPRCLGCWTGSVVALLFQRVSAAQIATNRVFLQSEYLRVGKMGSSESQRLVVALLGEYCYSPRPGSHPEPRAACLYLTLLHQ